MLFLMGMTPDGLHLCVAVKMMDDVPKTGEVVMAGIGVTAKDAQARCREYLIDDGYPEHEATPGEVVWRRPSSCN